MYELQRLAKMREEQVKKDTNSSTKKDNSQIFDEEEYYFEDSGEQIQMDKIAPQQHSFSMSAKTQPEPLNTSKITISDKSSQQKIKINKTAKNQQPKPQSNQQDEMIQLDPNPPKVVQKQRYHLRQRAIQVLQKILDQEKPLYIEEIVSLLSKEFTIPWEKSRFTIATVQRLISQQDDLRWLYNSMKKKLNIPIDNVTQKEDSCVQYFRKVLRLLQDRTGNKLYFAGQCQFPLFEQSDKQKRIIFRGVMGSNNCFYWDIWEQGQRQQDTHQSFSYILDLIHKKGNGRVYLIITRDFAAQYRQIIENVFKVGFHLIEFPAQAQTFNPLWYCVRDLRIHLRKNGVKTLKELNQFLHYQGIRLFERHLFAGYLCAVKKLMRSELNKGIEIGFNMSMQ